jgi:hypothetical protein
MELLVIGVVVLAAWIGFGAWAFRRALRGGKAPADREH